MLDPYAVLGVPPTASADEVRAAYRRLAIRHHPDKNASPDSAVRFRALREAYETLLHRRPGATYHRQPPPLDANSQDVCAVEGDPFGVVVRSMVVRDLAPFD